MAPGVEGLRLEPVAECVTYLRSEAVIIRISRDEDLAHGREARIRNSRGQASKTVGITAGGSNVGVGVRVGGRFVISVIAPHR